MTRVRVRGIYTTALTRTLREADHTVVQASEPIRERFDADFAHAPEDVAVATTDDRQGVGVSGDPEGVATVRALLTDAGRDAMAWDDPAPRGAVFRGTVTDTLGSGAVLDLGDSEGFLPYDATEEHVTEGDTLVVQVREAAAPWEDDRPGLGTGLELRNGLVGLSRERSGVTAAPRGERGTELARTTEILPADPPEGWGLRWRYAAADAGMDALSDALVRAGDAATDLAEAVDAAAGADPTAGDTERLAAPHDTAWVWFGREARFALDEDRRAVERTMPGHHRTKAATGAASAAVDFAEAVADGDWADGEFPFAAVTRQFGPTEGDRIRLLHGKPDGRLIALGRGELTDWDPEAEQVTLRRTMGASGVYDGLETPKERGDVAITKLREGRWWYPTVYRSEDGAKRGTYVNVCTPVELFPDGARYVDLHVDVVKRPDGDVERVDDDELEEAVAEGLVSEALAEKARKTAKAVESALE